MFEHLSDPNPPTLGDGFRHQVITTARKRQRRTRVSVGSIAITPLLVAGSIGIFLLGEANELERINVVGLAPAESSSPVDTDRTPATPVVEISPIATPLNILVAGVDRRAPGSEVEGSRGDSIAVVRIDPDQNRVSLLSLPRDLWVTNVDGTSGRINAFTDDGGLVEVVSSLLGIDINHYIEIDFDGFESLIDLAGGVSVPFENPVRDIDTGFTAEAGCNDLSGADALAYVRARKLEELDLSTGEWTIDPRADIGRIARQQEFVQRMYTAVLSQGYSAEDHARLLTDVVDDLTVDAGLDLDGVRAIFNAAALIGVDNFANYDLTASLTSDTIGGQSVLVGDPAGIQARVAEFLGTSVATRPESSILDHADAIEPATATC